MSIVEITSAEEYKSIISSNEVVVADFFATWCGPCKLVAPQFHSLAEKYPNVKFIKIDIDELEDLADEEGVASLPTFAFFVNGKKVNVVPGAQIGPIEDALKKCLEPAA